MDPVTVIGAIGSALGLIDKFVALIDKLRSKDTKQRKVEASDEGDAIVIRRDGVVVERVASGQLRLSSFDETRFSALRTRVGSLWNQFNGLYAQLPTVSVDERIRLEGRMDTMRKELCADFREMMDISEKVLGISLGDHYSLHRTCRDS